MNLSALNVEIWLHILQAGDWWTPQDVDRHFQFKPGTSFRRLHDMQRNGTLAKRPVQGTRSMKFAVTADCLVPRGITVGKVQVSAVAEEGARLP